MRVLKKILLTGLAMSLVFGFNLSKTSAGSENVQEINSESKTVLPKDDSYEPAKKDGKKLYRLRRSKVFYFSDPTFNEKEKEIDMTQFICSDTFDDDIISKKYIIKVERPVPVRSWCMNHGIYE